MAFVKKTWKDRIVQFANRRLLTKSGGEVEQVTVTRDEGTISEAGDQFNASNMNDLENRVDDGFSDTKDYIDGKTGSDIEWEANTGVSISALIRYLLMTEQADVNSSLNNGTATPRITYYPSTATNKPSGNSGVVITQGNGTYRQQLAIDLEGNIYARYYNNGTISNWKNNVEVVNTRLVNARLTWNGSYFTIPSSKPRPYSNQQITVLGRNLSNGAVYAVWYDSSTDGFRMSATLVGNAPSTNNTIDVQYLA